MLNVFLHFGWIIQDSKLDILPPNGHSLDAVSMNIDVILHSMKRVSSPSSSAASAPGIGKELKQSKYRLGSHTNRLTLRGDTLTSFGSVH